MMKPSSLAEWHAAGQAYRWREQDVFVRHGGEAGAPGLLLIHGFPSAGHDWHRLWDRLCERFRVVAPDMIGFGLSDKPLDFPYSVFAQADLLEDLLEREGIRRFTVLAHDYGDTVAQELLARHNEGALFGELNAVAFLNGGLFPEAHRPLAAQKLLLSPFGPLFARMIPRRKVAASFRRICSPALTDDDIEALCDLVEHNDGRRVMPRLIRYMQERRQHRERWVSALTEASVPLRLIDGVLDPISGEHLVRRYEALVPGADVVRLQGVGHYPQLEAPDAVWEAFAPWVP